MPLRKDAKIEVLRRTPLFSGCSKGELAAIAAIADEVEISEGKAFIREGERGREFFAVIEGTVEVRKKGRRMKIKGGNEVFGEIALVSNAPRNATVTAASPVSAFVITDRAFEGLMRRLPRLQSKVLRSLAERVAIDEPV
ncbi:MAG: cyclic nucleotide-binding domain-containing protein [Actinobacteria bacterium]|nr:cyclic nucleotide-binding domain-containing protein [Actinomycetota bacterium]